MINDLTAILLHAEGFQERLEKANSNFNKEKDE